MNGLVQIQYLIHVLIGQKVMFGSDLTTLYKVVTKVLYKAVKINHEIFLQDLVFNLIKDEYEVLTSQLVTSELRNEKICVRQYYPYVFINQGDSTLLSLLKSKILIQINVKIMRTFVKMRESLGLLTVYPFTIVSFFLRRIFHSLQQFHYDEFYFVPL